MLRRVSLLSALAFLGVLAGSAVAQATEAYVTRSSYLRAGPDTDFPRIVKIYRDEIVEVFGCTPTYDWCDVVYEDERGWFPGERLAFNVDGYGMPVDYIAPYIGLMILDFAFDDYWDRYYRNRPWYQHRRPHWHDWHLPPPPPGAPHPGAPPPPPQGGNTNPPGGPVFKPGFKPLPLPGKPPKPPVELKPGLIPPLMPKPGPVNPSGPVTNPPVELKPGVKPLAPINPQPEGNVQPVKPLINKPPLDAKPIMPKEPKFDGHVKPQGPAGGQPQIQQQNKKFCKPGQVCNDQ